MLRYIDETEEEILISIKKNGEILEFINDQTEEICLEAVRKDGLALRFVKNQTEEICREAIKKYAYAFQYVKNQTPELSLMAVKQYGCVLRFVKNQTEEICLAAVKQYGLALQYVKEQTPEICLEAFKQNKAAVEYIKIINFPKFISLNGDRKLINGCKKNNFETFNPRGEWNGNSFNREVMAVIINSKEEEEKFNIIKKEIEFEKISKVKKPSLTEEEKMEKWVNRLAKLTGINKEDALEIAKEKIENKEKEIQKLENKQNDNYSNKREDKIYELTKKNLFKHIKRKEYADIILLESVKYRQKKKKK